MKRAFHYSIIRFQPFPDSGEFANIGVLVVDTELGEVDFKLARQKFARIREFFGDEAYDAYKFAIQYLMTEFGYGRRRPFWTKAAAMDLFKLHVRPRESSVIFSDQRTILFDGRIEELTTQLYARFIERRRTDAGELTLIDDIRDALKTHAIRGFRAIKIEDPVVSVRFPIAHRNGELTAIQPLVFNQKTPLAIFDYGAHWKNRLSYLLNKKVLRDQSVMLAVDEPYERFDDASYQAFKEARSELRMLPFEIVSGHENGFINPRIIEFAEKAAPNTARANQLFN